ncbi:hypothetical protein PACTADRAFT_76599 [Pachysolen tannophilus NRRL Y-2460]|uniref:Man(5)GlcNAc(2)-PP-dolichol translocation protein RFT1 n=1 Tax=Pachysolen tannophilus NRRL Y-2460 TaxID=669874 RepID=A0A1E4TTF0_PACTA|nr:hypothetical protein PACTADRAFT_76599 [Pachysolen tannophilus NRRL Y-2460]
MPSMGNLDAKLLNKSAIGATFLMMGQIFTKIFTFILNQLLLRYISSNVFGITSFIEFLISCSLFYSREGIRLACQRINKNDQIKKNDEKNQIYDNTFIGTIQKIINLSYIPIIIGLPISIILLSSQLNIWNYKFHNISFILIWGSIILELILEPFYNLNQFELNFKIRTKIESISLIIKCILQFSCFIYFNKKSNGKLDNGCYVLSFVIGQFFYSLTNFSLYLLNYKYHKKYKENTIFLKKIFQNNNDNDNDNNDNNFFYFDKKAIEYWKNILIQLLFKYLLTEGDKFIINYLCSIDEQGIFALINNYGSLITRLIFAPIEETLRLYLTKLFSSDQQQHYLQLQKKNLLINILNLLIKFYLYLSFFILIFAPPNTKFLLELIVGKNWSSEFFIKTFKIYWLYLPFLSINGIMEAIFYSLADDSIEILNYSKYMILTSVIFIFNSIVLIKFFNLSIVGLIIANIINMLLRIVYCFKFLSKFINDKDMNLLSNLLLNDSNNFYCTISAIIIYLIHSMVIKNTQVSNFTDFVKSSILGFTLLCIFLIIERKLIIEKILPKKKIS